MLNLKIISYSLIKILILIDISFAQNQPSANTAGPNCHIINSSLSNNNGKSYKISSNNLLQSASVPDAVNFKSRNLLYYVNGNFDNHSIHVAELDKNGRNLKKIGPITLNGEIIKDAVDPDLIVTKDGRLRLFYYVGLFTKPVTYPKPNKFYSAISDDGVNFKIEGVIATLDNATDPSVTILNDKTYLLAIAQPEMYKIVFFISNDGYNFRQISELKGGIPELSNNNNGEPELIFQESSGFTLYSSKDNGKNWQRIKKNILSDSPVGVASPTILKISNNQRQMYYVTIKKDCSTPPTAYLEDKGALNNMQEMGPPPLGHGADPAKNKNMQEMGPPPLGHGVNPAKNKKKKKWLNQN